MNTPFLPQALLDEFATRTNLYDARNEFFHEDFVQLQQAGYLIIAVPEAFGGMGFTLAQVAREQRRLAYRSPATALAINMHLYWTGIAADLHRQGDHTMDWLLQEASDGEVFAAGHGEAGNDLPILYSSAQAKRVEGGYRFWGHKMFGSLTPVWTRLGIHAMDTSDPQQPKVVHAFMPREAQDYRIKENWDVIGMRATHSDDTVLDGVVIADHYVSRVIPADFAGADQFVVNLFAWALVNFGNIYASCAQRAFDLAVSSVRRKHSVALDDASMAQNPMIQYTVAEMAIQLENLWPMLDRLAEDWSNGVQHGGQWPAKIMATKYHAVESARRIANLALDIIGGGGVHKGTEFERLIRV